MVSNKVLIGVSTGEYARRADFYDYFHMLDKFGDDLQTFVLFGHDRSPAKNRNDLIKAGLDNECTHILLVDDDMAFKPDSLKKLLKHDKDIVSGLYLKGSYPHPPLVFDLADESGACMPMYLTPGVKRLVPIVAAGFGFLLVKISIFDKLTKPYVRMGEIDPEQWCDDMGFFKRVREAGIESYCDLDVMVGHIRSMIVWPAIDDKGDWYTSYDTNGSGAVNTPQFNLSYDYKFTESKVGVEK